MERSPFVCRSTAICSEVARPRPLSFRACRGISCRCSSRRSDDRAHRHPTFMQGTLNPATVHINSSLRCLQLNICEYFPNGRFRFYDGGQAPP